MKKQIKVLLMFSIIMLLAFSLAAAKNDNSNRHNQNNTNSTNSTRLNYGLCVSNYSHLQQDCFIHARQNHLNCTSIAALNISQLINQSQNNSNFTNLSKKEQKTFLRQFRSQLIDMKHECRDQYKEEKDQCRQEFKSNKLQCVQFRCNSNQIFSNETNKCIEKEKAQLGELCGGIAGIMCEKNLKCQYNGNYPDASGICVTKTTYSNNTGNNTNSTA